MKEGGKGGNYSWEKGVGLVKSWLAMGVGAAKWEW
jgi:hypothetical protein